MKTPRQQTRKINAVPTGRWAAYASAAAASTFTAANSAEAAIHYSGPIDHNFRGEQHGTFQLDPAGGAITFVHENFIYGSSSVHLGGSALILIDAPVSAALNGFLPSCARSDGSVSNLNRGDSIAPRPFYSGTGIMASLVSFSGPCHMDRGQFLEPGIGFIGFKFNNGNGVQYGWARVKMRGFPLNDFKVVDCAYGDPGETVRAGQKSSSLAPALQSLGALALGATGLAAWRRQGR